MKDLDFRGKLAINLLERFIAQTPSGVNLRDETSNQVNDRLQIHSHSQDQVGVFKMRRQLVRKTTRTNCNRTIYDWFMIK